MRYWNLTYNDPDRWREVYAISGPPLGFVAGIRASLSGRSTGSPKAELVDASCESLRDLLQLTSNLKWANFQRTQNGAILYFRVLLETYGLPLRTGEVVLSPLQSSTGDEVELTVQSTEAHSLKLRGPQERMERLRGWLLEALAARTATQPGV